MHADIIQDNGNVCKINLNKSGMRLLGVKFCACLKFPSKTDVCALTFITVTVFFASDSLEGARCQMLID